MKLVTVSQRCHHSRSRAAKLVLETGFPAATAAHEQTDPKVGAVVRGGAAELGIEGKDGRAVL